MNNLDDYCFIYNQNRIDKNTPLNQLHLVGNLPICVSLVKYARCVLDGEKKIFGYYTSFPFRFLLRFALNSFDANLKEDDFILKDDTDTYDLSHYVPLDGFPDDHTFTLYHKNIGVDLSNSTAQPEEPARNVPVRVLYKDSEELLSVPLTMTIRGVVSKASCVRC